MPAKEWRELQRLCHKLQETAATPEEQRILVPVLGMIDREVWKGEQGDATRLSATFRQEGQ